MGLERSRSCTAEWTRSSRARYTRIGRRARDRLSATAFRFDEGDPGRARSGLHPGADCASSERLPRAFAHWGAASGSEGRPRKKPARPAVRRRGLVDGSIPANSDQHAQHDLHRKYDLPDSPITRTGSRPRRKGEFEQLPTIRDMIDFNAYSEGGPLRRAPPTSLGLGDFVVGRTAKLPEPRLRACAWWSTGLHATLDPCAGHRTSSSHGSKRRRWPRGRPNARAGQAAAKGRASESSARSAGPSALGPRYDLRDFNDTVVKGGKVRSTLSKNVDAYVMSSRRVAPRLQTIAAREDCECRPPVSPSQDKLRPTAPGMQRRDGYLQCRYFA